MKILDDDFIDCFKDVPKTGVIYVLEQAVDKGYHPNDTAWANLGQGAPETGPLDGTSKPENIDINPLNSEYAPVSGSIELRKKVAEYYNHNFRSDKLSKYTYKNVCIAGGGRLALARVVAALGNIHLGHFIPDYTAYEELLSTFNTFIPIPILLNKQNNYRISTEELREEIVGKGLSSILISNPCNPTGQLIKGDELKSWVELSQESRCLMLFDEFYSHFLYEKNTELVSSANYIHDVNKDPVVIINGISKNWRSPGWRIGWIVAPEDIIHKVSSVGSFLDGGASHPLQEKALTLINPEKAKDDAAVIQSVFKKKREYTLKRLKKMGFIIDVDPEATFYVWCDISKLPGILSQSDMFFKECLKEKVITVPGVFFDVNPGKRRLHVHSRYHTYVRISFGPSMETLKTGLDSIERVIKKFT